jgi:small subunit ribosomal protein S13
MKNFIQLFNIQLNLEKKLLISLTYIFGINLFISNVVCTKFGFNFNSLLKDVNFTTLKEIRRFILHEYVIQDTLRKKVQLAILNLVSIKSVKGLRHKLKLPVRGQRTRSNHKTRQKLI